MDYYCIVLALLLGIQCQCNRLSSQKLIGQWHCGSWNLLYLASLMFLCNVGSNRWLNSFQVCATGVHMCWFVLRDSHMEHFGVNYARVR